MAGHFDPTRSLDVSRLLEAGAAPDPALDAAVLGALRDDGAFFATAPDASVDVEARAQRVVDFFHLPIEARMRLATRSHRPGSPNLYRGYYPLPEGRGWAHKEGYDAGPEHPVPVPDGAPNDAFREPTPWPDAEPTPGWRAAVRAHVAHGRSLALAVLGALERALDLPAGHLADACAGGNLTLRLLRYPPPPERFEAVARHGDSPQRDEAGRRIITQRHVDTGHVSVLWQDATGGLQMQGPDGTWREVPAAPGGLSVHCGDLLAGPTGGVLAGTPHRVTGGAGDRRSLGLFVEPDFVADVHPPDGSPPLPYAAHLRRAFPGRFAPPREAALA